MYQSEPCRCRVCTKIIEYHPRQYIIAQWRSPYRLVPGKKKKPKPLTRFCQICRGFSHQTIDCWHQEKNGQHRPKARTTERAAIEEAMIISADPLPIWPGQQRQRSEDVDKERGEEDVDKGTEEGKEGTAD